MSLLFSIFRLFFLCFSQIQELDVAIVKATNHVEGHPKERHLRSQRYSSSRSLFIYLFNFDFSGLMRLDCLLQKSWLLRQLFGLEPMLLIAFTLFPADWPKPIIGRYRFCFFWETLVVLWCSGLQMNWDLINICICPSNVNDVPGLLRELFKVLC